MNGSKKVSLALLIGRVPIGFYFLAAGYNKIAGTGVKSFVDGAAGNVPPWADALGKGYLYALPFAECLFGLLVVIGLLTRSSAAMLSLMLISFLIAQQQPAYIHNILGNAPGTPFDRNWLLLSGTLALALLGPGSVAIDHFIQNRRRKAVERAEKAASK